MKTVIIDTETNALHGYDKCWVVVCRDVDTDEVATFRHIHEVENAKALLDYLRTCNRVVGHNLIGFDVGVLAHFGLGEYLEHTELIDTLIISRLLNYSQEGGHSLEAWGKRFGFPKDNFNDFSRWSEELEQRCIVDTLLTKRLYNTFSKYLKSSKWKKPIELEHKVATLCNTLNTNGFSFNIQLAKELHKELSSLVNNLKEEFHKVFPPKSTLLREITPSITKSGSLHAKDFKWLPEKDLTPYSAGATFSLFEYEVFNPNSPKQVVARLNEAGWKPTERTKSYIEAERNRDKEALERLKETAWKISEENLETLPTEEDMELWESKCLVRIQLNEKSINEIITKGTKSVDEKLQDVITTPIKSIIKTNSLSESMESLRKTLVEWLQSKDIIAEFVESQQNLWSIIVTQQGVFVDCSATFAMDTWVGLRGTEKLQQRISLIKAAKKLTSYLLLSSRLSDLEEWINLYNPETGKIHGTFNGIGSWTHRKSHQRPNMANIPALVNRSGKPQPYGEAFRSLWTASPGRVLVGCDAEGIQLRLFAHYCADRKLIEAIVNGKKEEKTDIHSLNMQVLNPICNSREVAKTYIYALLLGAGAAKQASILDCSKPAAAEGLNRILQFYPGWKELKETRLKRDAEVGYFEGLDGRLVIFPAAHYVLAGYLQNGESVVMKMASVLWTTELDKLGIPYSFVNDVHDEVQVETLPEYGNKVGQTIAQSIVTVGEELGLNCPLAAKYVIGKTWAETH